MKIVFLCGCIELGKDGVGDYTIQLGTELVRKGNYVTIIALQDNFVTNFSDAAIAVNGHQMQLIRYPADSNVKLRFKKLETWLNQQSPDWLSLQFVPYAFHYKGLPFTLANALKQLGAFRWHIMFHELWVGVKGNNNIKEKITGFLQKRIINNLVEKITPHLITTSIPLYKKAIGNYPTKLLPLCSNIPITYSEIKTPNNKPYFQVIHFGSFSSHNYLFKKQVEWIKELATLQQKNVLFIVAGNGGPFKQAALAIASELIGKDAIQEVGQLPTENISELLIQSDIGISRADYDYYGKSGSTLAMLEHGLPVVLRGERPTYLFNNHDLFAAQLFFSSDAVPQIIQKKEPISRLEFTAETFIQYLRNAK